MLRVPCCCAWTVAPRTARGSEALPERPTLGPRRCRFCLRDGNLQRLHQDMAVQVAPARPPHRRDFRWQLCLPRLQIPVQMRASQRSRHHRHKRICAMHIARQAHAAHHAHQHRRERLSWLLLPHLPHITRVPRHHWRRCLSWVLRPRLRQIPRVPRHHRPQRLS